MSSVEEENMTSSDMATPINMTYFWRHPVPNSVAWLPCLACLAVTTVVVNALTCVVLVFERALQTTLYTYLTSLVICDVIGSSVVTPIVAARTSLGAETTQRLGDLWYVLDAAWRTAQFVHLIAAAFDATWQLSGALHTHSKRYLASGGSRHVIPRRSLAPRLVLVWLTTLIVATSPFVWFHLMTDRSSSAPADAWKPLEQSNYRKLVLCVFVLSFAIPAAGLIAAYSYLIRTWITTAHADRSLAVVMTKPNLLRGSSYRSSRVVRTRQSSVRASKRSKSGTGGRTHSPAGGKSSPQLDRHPSVRYSIRRRRDGSKSSLERDSAEASLLAEVIAAEAAASRHDNPPASARDDVERELDRVASVLSMLNATGSKRGSPKSNRSSRSDRCASGPASPKLDRHPSLRYSVKKPTSGLAVSVSGIATTGGSGETDARGTDPYTLLTGLQQQAQYPSLKSSPTDCTVSPRDVMATVGLSPRGSREQLAKALTSSAGKKRSFVRRHSSRGKRSSKSSGPDSPRLDRHPSLRFSTTRLSAGRGARPSPTAKSCTLAVTKPPLPAPTKNAPDPASTSTEDRKGSSESNASSIGTCHDLRLSASAYSVTRSAPHPERHRSSSSTDTGAVTGGDAGREEGVQRRLVTDDDHLALGNRSLDVSRINLLHTAPSDHEMSSGRRRVEDGAITVDRLSPAACRRRPQTPEATPIDVSNHRRDVQASSDARQTDAVMPTGCSTAESTDLVLIGASVLVLLLLTTPAMIVGLVAAMGADRSGRRDKPNSVDVVFSLQAVVYVGALARPLVYYAFSSIVRQSLVSLVRCRRAGTN